MADLGKIMWRGRSGREYRYSIYQIGADLEAGPGNYIFAEETTPGTFLPVYVGHSADLSERLDRLGAMPCIRRNNAVFIHVRLNDEGEKARIAEANDLIALWNPPCNCSTRPLGTAVGGAAIGNRVRL